jgi:hypothetical protein
MAKTKQRKVRTLRVGDYNSTTHTIFTTGSCKDVKDMVGNKEKLIKSQKAIDKKRTLAYANATPVVHRHNTRQQATVDSTK